eukprot:808561-Rhodomonas_salina.3
MSQWADKASDAEGDMGTNVISLRVRVAAPFCPLCCPDIHCAGCSGVDVPPALARRRQEEEREEALNFFSLRACFDDRTE